MSNKNITGPALPPSMGKSKNDDSDEEDASMFTHARSVVVTLAAL